MTTLKHDAHLTIGLGNADDECSWAEGATDPALSMEALQAGQCRRPALCVLTNERNLFMRFPACAEHTAVAVERTDSYVRVDPLDLDARKPADLQGGGPVQGLGTTPEECCWTVAPAPDVPTATLVRDQCRARAGWLLIGRNRVRFEVCDRHFGMARVGPDLPFVQAFSLT